MARQSTRKKNWLIFVDTNIFLDFYRIGGESAERQLKALERHQDSLITGDQIRMEFLKNRQTVIVESMKQLVKPTKITVPPIITDYQPAKALSKHISDASNKYKEIKIKVEKVLKDPLNHDPVYQSINRILNNPSTLNLCRPDKKRFEIRNLARKRFALGYPPRKNSDTSIGDAVNWEWIVKCAQQSTSNHNILIVSRDGDYGIAYEKEVIINDWLRREFKDRVSKKREIELTNKLTTALSRLDEKVDPDDIREEEEVIDKSSGYFGIPSDVLAPFEDRHMTLFRRFYLNALKDGGIKRTDGSEIE